MGGEKTEKWDNAQIEQKKRKENGEIKAKTQKQKRVYVRLAVGMEGAVDGRKVIFQYIRIKRKWLQSPQKQTSKKPGAN